MITVIACVAQFVVVLDVTIVAIALPAMQADLGLSTTALGWVITAYTLVFGGCLLAAGRLADRLGRRRAFTGGLAALVLALTLAETRGPLAGPTVGALAAAVALLAALALVEARAPSPLLDRALLRRPGVAGPNAVAAVLTATT